MRPVSFKETRQKLVRILALAESVGIDIDGRVGTYVERIRRLMDIIAQRDMPDHWDGRDDILDVAALIDGLELASTLEFLETLPEGAVRAKLTHILGGPAVHTDEDQNTNQPRNVLFELAIAARLASAGAKVVLDEHPDVEARYGGRRFLIECKRPFSDAGVSRNLAKAAGQLAEPLQDDVHAYGIIAISADKILNPTDQRLAVWSDEQADRGLRDRLEPFAVTCLPDLWKTQPSRIIAGLFHFRAVAVERLPNRYSHAEVIDCRLLNAAGERRRNALAKLRQLLNATRGPRS